MTVFSDVELLESARDGDKAALAELYIRHRGVARRVASTTCGRNDPDDLVNEAFEKVFAAVRRRTGPTEAFRAYLFVTIRRLAARQSSRSRDEPYEEVPEPVKAWVDADELDPAEREMITAAFANLPDRWQSVLWHTAVEGRHPRDVARLLGMSSNAVSALAYRAREALRQSYLQAHLQASPQPECQPHRSALGAYVRNGLGRRDRAVVERHLEDCPSCRTLLSELGDVNHLLARAVLPLFLVESLGEVVTTGSALASGLGAVASSAASNAGGGVRRLLRLLPESASVGQAVGGIAAAAALLGTIGGASTLLLQREPDRPSDTITMDAPATSHTEASEPAPSSTAPTSAPTTDPCAPNGSPTASPSASLREGANRAGTGEAAGARADGSGLLGVDVEGVLVALLGSPLTPTGTHAPAQQGCRASTTTTTTTTTQPPAPPTTEAPPTVETEDLVPDVAPGLLPDLNTELTVQLQDGTRVEVHTNLGELCSRPEDQDVVCDLDRALGGQLTTLLAETGVSLGVETPAGQVLDLDISQGDLGIGSELLQLLPNPSGEAATPGGEQPRSRPEQQQPRR